MPACLPLLLLLLSGDIETNPGPYKCPTCNRPWTRRTVGIQCGGCDSWTHYNIRCSGVRHHAHIPQGWRCIRCHPSHNMTLPPLSSPSTPPPPVSSPLSPTPLPLPLLPVSPLVGAPEERESPPPPPALTPSRPQNNTLNILQINTNGIRNKIMELRALLHEQHIHIATIQESKLTTTSNTPSFPGYTTLRHDRPTRGGGGLLTLIHKDIPFTNTTAETHARMTLDPTLEIQSTRIQIQKHHYNIYIPPTDSTPSLNYLNTITNSYILGDFNAHDPVWLTTQNTDTRATTLQEQLDSYIILNNPIHPHVNPSKPTPLLHPPTFPLPPPT